MAETILELADVRYRYPTGVEALRGVTFSVAVGERVGLVGPNGAGKSTLLLALAGFVAAEGHIRVAGHTIARATARDVAGTWASCSRTRTTNSSCRTSARTWPSAR